MITISPLCIHMNKAQTYTEQELVARIKDEGSRKEAVVQLYQHTKDNILRFVLKYGGKNEDRDELMNEGFLVLIKSVEADKFQFQAQLSTYYIGICRRIWLNWRKKDTAEAGRHNPITEQTEASLFVGSIQDDIEKEERLHILDGCLDELGERGKELLIMSREDPPIPWPKIAEMLAFSSHQTAKNAAQRFMKRVSDCVQAKLAA